MASSFPTYEKEDTAKRKGYRFIVGVDEVGRGCGAGPVVAAAVHVPDEAMVELVGKVDDSKKLSARKRERLYDNIMRTCSVGFGDVGAETIDRVNILEATKMAMIEALGYLPKTDYVLVDGTVDLSRLTMCRCEQVIKGDSISISIAAASVVAKVVRDRIMDDLHKEYPMYGWDKNRSYLTKQHVEALEKYGLTPHHRKTFGICRDYV